MRRFAKTVAVLLAVLLVVAACGKKDVSDVVKDLEETVSKLNSYQSSGKMVLLTGNEPQEYAVEVWYLQPHYYRISLTNQKKDITQIVLKNDDGVFVLTPSLNKSFRFQSNWPTEQGQIYLYQTLVQSIIKDEQRSFVEDSEQDAFVFDVAADYQNASFSRQKIWLEKDNYAPRKVEITDSNSNVLIVLEFDKFEFNHNFSADDFDMQRNMTSWNLQTLPAMSEEEAESDVAEQVPTGPFGVIEPTYLPEGVQKISVEDIEWGEGTAVMLRYGGEYTFTLLETRPQEQSVTADWGEVVDLGYTIAVLTGENQKTLRWVSDGVEFRLISGDLPLEEMIEVAKSVYGQIGK
jgi:outer membrane lipoprotein-sorting protein